MKLVLVAFDSVSHQPKSTNMISMLQDNHIYSIDNAYVDDIKTLNEIYSSVKPDVFLIDTTFKKQEIMEFLTEDVSLDTIRKSVYKVKDNIDANISPTLRHSIFMDNNIKDMNLPDFFDYIVEYIEGLK